MHSLLWVGILLILSNVCGNRKGDMNNDTLKYYRSMDSLDRFDDPTREELSRAYLIKPQLEWGSIFRHQRSIRCMSLGGSNTYNGAYSALLDRYFKEFISADSYCMNEGLSGMGPLEAADLEYLFLSWPTSNWPNLISLEFSINCRSKFDCAKDIHDLMFHLINLYNKRGLTPPRFIFYEFITIGVFRDTTLNGKRPSRAERLQFLNTYHNIADPGIYFDRGCSTCAYTTALFRFYNFPYISIVDALFPSYVRHYLNDSTYDKPWMWVADGTHLSEYGNYMIVEHVLKPFYLHIMEERVSYYMDYNIYPTNPFNISDTVTMFPLPEDRFRRSVEGYWSSWIDTNDNFNTLSNIASAMPMKSWVWTSSKMNNDHDVETIKDHTCFGSTVYNSTAILQFYSPLKCHDNSQYRCEVLLYYIHSWNTTHFGDTFCELYGIEEQRKVKLAEVSILGSLDSYGSNLRVTVPVAHTISSNVLDGAHTLECKVASMNRLSCITGLKLVAFEVKRVREGVT